MFLIGLTSNRESFLSEAFVRSPGSMFIPNLAQVFSIQKSDQTTSLRRRHLWSYPCTRVVSRTEHSYSTFSLEHHEQAPGSKSPSNRTPDPSPAATTPFKEKASLGFCCPVWRNSWPWLPDFRLCKGRFVLQQSARSLCQLPRHAGSTTGLAKGRSSSRRCLQRLPCPAQPCGKMGREGYERSPP